MSIYKFQKQTFLLSLGPLRKNNVSIFLKLCVINKNPENLHALGNFSLSESIGISNNFQGFEQSKTLLDLIQCLSSRHT